MKAVIFPLLAVCLVWAAKPMEPLVNYNVVMVHGASAEDNGLQCSNSVEDAYNYFKNKWKLKADAKECNDLGKAVNSIGLHWNRGYDCEDDTYEGYNLTYWLDSTVFENTIETNGSKRYDPLQGTAFNSPIYIQRSFINPAESPAVNAHELGSRAWVGCGSRRSLIEEAQEVRAKGRTNLENLRKSLENRNELPPSRNILIAHSMGGVISREYVQSDFYKEDVDKVITLDSSYEGSGVLNNAELDIISS